MLWTPLDAVSAIDQFNDSDFSEYGNATDMSQNTSTTQEGGSACEFASGSPNLSISQNGDGLNNYVQQGDTFRGWARTTGSSAAAGFIYGAQDTNNYFRVLINAGSNEVILFKKASTNNQILNVNATINADTWYEIKLTWDDGTQGGSQGDHTVDVFDTGGNSIDADLPATGNDTDFASEDGVGVFNSSAASLHDNWRLV